MHKTEKFTVEECPVCQKNHDYTLDIEQQTVQHFSGPSGNNYKMIVVLLTCPAKDKTYRIQIKVRGEGISKVTEKK